MVEASIPNTQHSVDIELGSRTESSYPYGQPHGSSLRRTISALVTRFRSRTRFRLKKTLPSAFHGRKRRQVEDHPKGYPRLSALIATHDSLHIFRRFSHLRARLLLIKQDKIVQLENKLEKIDREERSPLFLASNRRDTNPYREEALADIENKLVEFDELLERTRRVRSLENPHNRSVLSLHNWLAGTVSISREEVDFLAHEEDLFSLSEPSDGVFSAFEQLSSRGLVYIGKRLWPASNMSRDPRVFIFSRSFTNRATRILLIPFTVCLLLLPVIVCNMVGSTRARFITIIVAISILIAILSLLTRSNTVKTIVACATYSAVLMVFVAD